MRRGRDSNPRYPCGYVGFQDRCIQPLCHLSGTNNPLARNNLGRIDSGVKFLWARRSGTSICHNFTCPPLLHLSTVAIPVQRRRNSTSVRMLQKTPSRRQQHNPSTDGQSFPSIGSRPRLMRPKNNSFSPTYSAGETCSYRRALSEMSFRHHAPSQRISLTA
jgi:hypothetical protein